MRSSHQFGAGGPILCAAGRPPSQLARAVRLCLAFALGALLAVGCGSADRQGSMPKATSDQTMGGYEVTVHLRSSDARAMDAVMNRMSFALIKRKPDLPSIVRGIESGDTLLLYTASNTTQDKLRAFISELRGYPEVDHVTERPSSEVFDTDMVVIYS